MLARASFIQQCLAILLINLARISCWVGPWTLARTEPSNFQICLPHWASVVMSFLKMGPFSGLELLPGDWSSRPWLAGSHSHMNLSRAQMPLRQQEHAEASVVGRGCSQGCQCSQGSHLDVGFTTRFSSLFLLKTPSGGVDALNVQTHLDTLMILQLLPQLQVELWATKEVIDEKHGPFFLMTKAVNCSWSLFPRKLRCSSNSTLTSSQCCPRVSRPAMFPFDSAFLGVLLPACIPPGRHSGLECCRLEQYRPLRRCVLPYFTLFPKFLHSKQPSQPALGFWRGCPYRKGKFVCFFLFKPVCHWLALFFKD